MRWHKMQVKSGFAAATAAADDDDDDSCFSRTSLTLLAQTQSQSLLQAVNVCLQLLFLSCMSYLSIYLSNVVRLFQLKPKQARATETTYISTTTTTYSRLGERRPICFPCWPKSGSFTILANATCCCCSPANTLPDKPIMLTIVVAVVNVHTSRFIR